MFGLWASAACARAGSLTATGPARVSRVRAEYYRNPLALRRPRHLPPPPPATSRPSTALYRPTRRPFTPYRHGFFAVFFFFHIIIAHSVLLGRARDYLRGCPAFNLFLSACSHDRTINNNKKKNTKKQYRYGKKSIYFFFFFCPIKLNRVYINIQGG